MPKWTPLPTAPLKFNPYQDAFWKAHRARLCNDCQIEFEAISTANCPQCDKKGQRKFHRLTLLAGRRGGKTKAASIAAVEEACIPNSIVWCCAPTNPKLHRYVIPALQELIPPSWVTSWSSEYLDLRLKNGSLIHMQTLEDPDQGRGQGLDCVWVDEACELTLDHWLVLRPSLTERRGSAIFSSSPRSFDWVWEEFYSKAEQEVPGYWACRYKTSDNPIIDLAEIADARATMPTAMFLQEYEADFVVFTGAVYGAAIDPQILHSDEAAREIIPEWPQINPERQVLVGLDTGADHPFGAVKLVSTERGLVVVGEYLERNKSFIEHAGAIIRLANSASAKYAINRNEKQGMLELAQHRIYCQPAENDVVSGTERIKSWLHTGQLFFVASRCPHTIKEMKAYRWADNTAKDASKRTEKVYKRDDELPDALRYALQTWPVLPRIPIADGHGRDLSAMPEKMRFDIEQLRRIDKAEQLKPQDVVGDFWT